jgi:hypothetical protein
LPVSSEEVIHFLKEFRLNSDDNSLFPAVGSETRTEIVKTDDHTY